MGKKGGKKVVEPKPKPESSSSDSDSSSAAPVPAKPAAAAPRAVAAEEDELPVETAQEVAKYDLTRKMTPYLDKHLAIRLLASLEVVGVYKERDVMQAQLNVVAQTRMIDLALDIHEKLGTDPPKSLMDRREEVLQEIQHVQGRVKQMLHILEDQDLVPKIPKFESIEKMCEAFDLDLEVVGDLLEYAMLTFDMGNYLQCKEVLKHFRNMSQVEETMPAKFVKGLWGSLACGILELKEGDEVPDVIREAIVKLDDHLDRSTMPKREILVHRTWLLHWMLFVIFHGNKADPQVTEKIIDIFLSEKNMSIISLSCPHLFRYVGACLILHKRLKKIVPETVWNINHEANGYSDPITRFLLALYTEMDYEDAQLELKRCEMVCRGDHFLAKHWPEIQENARLHIFESYCRIHQSINIQMLATNLNMQPEEAELWIVKLIQSARLDARIDSEKSRVVMTKAPPNVYQQVIEKTKNLTFRTTMMVANLEKL